MEYNTYDELNEDEEAVLRMSEDKLTIWQMASKLNKNYAAIINIRSQMKKKGIFVPSNRIIDAFTEEIKQKIKDMDMEGMSNRSIAQSLMVKESTLQLWKTKMRIDGHVFKAKSG